MNNFDFLLRVPKAQAFAQLGIKAENLLGIDPGATVMHCRRLMETTFRWLYSVEPKLVTPAEPTLVNLMSTPEIRKIINPIALDQLHMVRKAANQVVHSDMQPNKEQAETVLRLVFFFVDWLSHTYLGTPEHKFHTPNTTQQTAIPAAQNIPDESKDPTIEALTAANKTEREANAERKKSTEAYETPKLDELTEAQTRKFFIDVMLRDAGWKQHFDWVDEFPIPDMPNKGKMGYADYVLLDTDGKPLAVVEAKKTSVSPETGRHQAQLYANLLEQKFGTKPVVFLCNGFEIRIFNDGYPERKISSFYSKKDLQAVKYKQLFRKSFKDLDIDDAIAGRYYQKAAVRAVTEAFEANHRKALLVMATGSGKTRTVMQLIKTLSEHNWVKNVLFLADRTCLVKQAHGATKMCLPQYTITNLCEPNPDTNARIVFSTYQTMIGYVDSAKDENGNRLYTAGHFDLIICDEAHRSVYNKYKEIFNYFDSLLVGLTATPKEDIDKNTYSVFDLNNGDPTYYYGLDQAVKDHYLVNYKQIEMQMNFLRNGIKYDELSEEEKREWEKTFDSDEDIAQRGEIDAAAINKWVYNRDTIRKVLHALMDQGIRVNYGNRIGKTIIFARNHEHAELIRSIFEQEYPTLINGFCEVIDNHIKYAQDLIDSFGEDKASPQIAVSVDMLDTGVDIPDCVNLVFFKPVYSRAKFWQMIGRGTRLCKGLLDGYDKDCFYVFDCCGNFDFFLKNPKGFETPAQMTLEQRIFHRQAQLLMALQQSGTKEYLEYQRNLTDILTNKVRSINTESFAAFSHRTAIETYSNPEKLTGLTKDRVTEISKELGHLIASTEQDSAALRFDALVYSIEIHVAEGTSISTGYKKVVQLMNELMTLAPSIKAIERHEPMIQKLLDADFIDKMGLMQWELARKELRSLIKYVPTGNGTHLFFTNFDDEMISITITDPVGGHDSLLPYKDRLEKYVRDHINDGVIAKLHTNQPLTGEDVKELERIVWKELGSQDEFVNSFPGKNVGVLIREIGGLDREAAKQAFSRFLTDERLNSKQIHFINMIIDYVVENGLIENNKRLLDKPFDSFDIAEMFQDQRLLFEVLSTVNEVRQRADIAGLTPFIPQTRSNASVSACF